MTNVPENIRSAWADVYKLFDANYNMDGSNASWIMYWHQAVKLIDKYGEDISLMEILEAVSSMLAEIIKKREEII